MLPRPYSSRSEYVIHATPDQKTPTILLVEDQEVMRDMLARMLGRAGYSVVSAAHGIEGLARLREVNVDLVITDVLMPEMNGIDFLRVLARERPNVRMIALSGADRRARHFKRAMQLGAKATLRKPVTRSDLLQTVQNVIATVR
jgi:two-component system cell cycle sensor histidine kinase/response regulator CckA